MDAPIVVLLAVLSGLFGVGLGALGFFFVWNNVSGNRMETAKNEASKVVEDARSEERRLVREAREEAKRTVSSGESRIRESEDELRERRREVQRESSGVCRIVRRISISGQATSSVVSAILRPKRNGQRRSRTT